MPDTLRETYEWLKHFSKSNVVLDENGSGLSEGVVVRSEDRSYIKKIRFEDYEKTERKGMMEPAEAIVI